MIQTIQINRKWPVVISILMLVWISGILLAPVLAATDSLFAKKISAFMYFFYEPTCHQIPDRSFSIFSFPFAVCIRCFTIYAGILLTAIFVIFRPALYFLPLRWYLILLIPVMADFIFEKIDLYNNLPVVRMITGGISGVVLAYMILASLSDKQEIQ